MNAAFRSVLFVSQAHEPLTASEEGGECLGEILVHAGEGLVKFLMSDLIDFPDGRLGVLDRIHQVLALGFEEVVAFRRFLVFLERHHDDRPHGLELLLQPTASLILFRQRLAFEAGDLAAEVPASMPRSLRQAASMYSSSTASLAVCAGPGATRLAERIHFRTKDLEIVLQLFQLLAQQPGFFCRLCSFFQRAFAGFGQALAFHFQLLVFTGALLLFRSGGGQLLLQLVDPALEVTVHAIDAGEGCFAPRLRSSKPARMAATLAACCCASSR